MEKRIGSLHDIRKILGSPFMAITAALFTAGCIAGRNTGVINILMIVSMWITYASAVKKDRAFKTTGMSIISGIYIYKIVCLSISFIAGSIVLAILFLHPEILAGPYRLLSKYVDLYFDFEMPEAVALSTFVIGTIIAVWVCLFIIKLFYSIFVRRSANAVKFASTQVNPPYNVSIFAAVMLIIESVKNIGSLVLTLMYMDDINGFLNAILNQLDIPFKFNYYIGFPDLAGNIVSSITGIFGAVILFRLHGAIRKNVRE